MYRTRDIRRALNNTHYKRDLQIARIPQYNSSLWWSEEKRRLVHPGRGKRSRYIKTTCKRRLRRKMNRGLELGDGGSFKRVTDFWWEFV